MNFFKGYYLKHQKNDNVLALIIGNTHQHEFLQIISNDFSYYIPNTDGVSFNDHGIQLDIQYNELSISGALTYSGMRKLSYDIMGFFKYLPLQCKHHIYSMKHSLKGILYINDVAIDFTGGNGYMEGDSGHTFPKEYVWVQANDFAKDLSIFCAVAHIPFLITSFKGCIACILYQGKEYRFATYLGVKVLKSSKQEIILKQGLYLFKINFIEGKYLPLIAPKKGEMIDTIKECVQATVRFKFYIDDQLIFDKTSYHASME